MKKLQLIFLFICLIVLSGNAGFYNVGLYNVSVGTDIAVTKFLVHLNSYDSSSTNPKPTNITGTAVLDPTVRKFGPASFKFVNSLGNITTPDSDDFDVTVNITESWTVETWVKFDPAIQTGADWFFVFDEDSNDYWTVGYQAGFTYRMVNNGSLTCYVDYCGGTGARDDGLWHHICLIKVLDEYGLFLDGDQIGYKKSSNTDTYTAAGTILKIGGDSSLYFSGWMDDCRINRSNVYSVTPLADNSAEITVPTAKLTADSNTSILWQANKFEVAYNVAPDFLNTPNNDVTNKKFGSGSYYFTTNEYISFTEPNATAWDLVVSNADDWTVDFWVKEDGNNTIQPYISRHNTSYAYGNYWSIRKLANNTLEFNVRYNNTTNIITATSTATLTGTDWHHICLVKKANEYGVYLDGDQVAYTQDNDTFDVTTGTLRLGGGYITTSTIYYLKGWLDEVRIQHDNYFEGSPDSGLTDTITVPTAEYVL